LPSSASTSARFLADAHVGFGVVGRVAQRLFGLRQLLVQRVRQAEIGHDARLVRPHAYRGLVIILRLLVIAELIGDGTLGR